MVMVLLLTACNDRVKYNHYVSIPEEGWGKCDTLVFGIDPLVQDGRYNVVLCLRSNSDYPYRYLRLYTEVGFFSQNKSVLHNVEVKSGTPTACCRWQNWEIKQQDGVATGSGITYYNHEIPLETRELDEGDSIYVIVEHHMRREYIPGITDVGVKLIKLEK